MSMRSRYICPYVGLSTFIHPGIFSKYKNSNTDNATIIHSGHTSYHFRYEKCNFKNWELSRVFVFLKKYSCKHLTERKSEYTILLSS